MHTQITIDGNAFSSMDEFYDEVERKLTHGLDWRIGRNLDAFNDVLRGGFGMFEYLEGVLIIWENSSKSKIDLGFDETIKYLEQKIINCHPSNIPFVQEELQMAKAREGQTLFDIILEIINDHNHIELRLQ